MNSILRQVRKNLGLTQAEVSKYLDIPLETIKEWEEEITILSKDELDLVLDKLLSYHTHQHVENYEGIYTYSILRKKISDVAKKYDISKIILFGSYAKGLAKATSDIDLVVTTNVTGFEFFGMLDDFITSLNKEVDLIREKDIIPNSPVNQEIERTGVVIYERKTH